MSILENVFAAIVEDDADGPYYFGRRLYEDAVSWWHTTGNRMESELEEAHREARFWRDMYRNEAPHPMEYSESALPWEVEK